MKRHCRVEPPVQSSLGNSFTTFTTSGPLGLHAFMGSTRVELWGLL